jgi:ribonuclease D
MSASAPGQPRPVLVDRPEDLAALAGEIAGEELVALDTESNSFHAYRERICLMQITTRRADYVIDPLAVDVHPLGRALTDGREVVLHGADYDVRCLKRELGWSFPRLFDTMAAARRLGRLGLGLSALVSAHFGIALSKEHQRSDWGRRPLSSDQLRYAALDTHFLLPLQRLLAAELEAAGRLGEARKEFERIAAAEPRPKVFDPEGYRRLKAARDLDPAARPVLRALYLAREERASALDRPPFKVLAEQTMVEIARRRPRTAEELARIPGVTIPVMRRLGDVLLAALQRAADP